MAEQNEAHSTNQTSDPLMATLFDPWQSLQSLFTNEADHPPEILITGLDRAGMRRCLEYLLVESRQINTLFRLPQTGEAISLINVTLDALLALLTEGDDLELIALCTLHLPAVPMLALFVDRIGELGISYSPGDEWNALRLLGLLELLRTLLLLAPGASVQADPYCFQPHEVTVLNRVFQDYFHAHH